MKLIYILLHKIHFHWRIHELFLCLCVGIKSNQSLMHGTFPPNASTVLTDLAPSSQFHSRHWNFQYFREIFSFWRRCVDVISDVAANELPPHRHIRRSDGPVIANRIHVHKICTHTLRVVLIASVFYFYFRKICVFCRRKIYLMLPYNTYIRVIYIYIQ